MAIARATAPLTTPSAVYTSSGTTAITAMYMCNYTGSTVTVTVHVVPNGGTADNTNIIYKDVDIIATDTFLLDTERLILDNGETVQIAASAASAVAITTSYLAL
jgi:hypothetical protein